MNLTENVLLRKCVLSKVDCFPLFFWFFFILIDYDTWVTVQTRGESVPKRQKHHDNLTMKPS